MSPGPVRRAAFFCVLIDPEHDIAGFVMDWISALAGRLDSLEVIALETTPRGVAALPANVRLHPLGKEKGYGRGRILANAVRAAGRALGPAEFILCHMMPVYALAAWPAGLVRRKPLFLWYTHQHLDLKLRLAAAVSDRVLTAAPEAMRVPTAKKRVLGHGISTDRFRPAPDGEKARAEETGPIRVLSVGRLSPVKRLEVLVQAAENLKERGELARFRFILAGQPSNPAQEVYAGEVKARIRSEGLEGSFEFLGSVPFARIGEVYQEADLFVSMQEQRGLDKAVLEAMACGLLVVAANESFRPLLGDLAEELIYPADQPAGLAQRLLNLAGTESARRRELGLKLRERVEAEHGLGRLMDRILAEAAAVRG